jgi:hypothetical protein
VRPFSVYIGALLYVLCALHFLSSLFKECIKKLAFFHSDFKAESVWLFNSCYLKQIINLSTFCLTIGLRSSDSDVESD